jgi:hypothetical protein
MRSQSFEGGENYLSVAGTVVVQRENLVGGDGDTLSRILLSLILVDVITEMKYPIVLILTSSVAVGIEVPAGCNIVQSYGSKVFENRTHGSCCKRRQRSSSPRHHRLQ